MSAGVPTLDGPRIPAQSGKASSLVAFLHGYGADGNDLIGIGRMWSDALPGTAFVSPHAPWPCEGAPYGRQWFPLSAGDPDRLWAGVVGAAPALDAFLDQELAHHGLAADRLALVGFSQGTMMALHVGARRSEALSGIVGYSGLLAGPERLAAEARTRPPVLLVHGDADPVIPVQALPAASQALGAAEFPVEWHIRPGLAHGIDDEGLSLGAEFLRRGFA